MILRGLSTGISRAFIIHEFILFHGTALITLMIDDADNNEVWIPMNYCAYS